MTEKECASYIKLLLSEYHGVGILEDMEGTCANNNINGYAFVYTACRMPINLPLDYRAITNDIMNLKWRGRIRYFAFCCFKLEGPYQDHEPQGPHIRFGSISDQELQNVGLNIKPPSEFDNVVG